MRNKFEYTSKARGFALRYPRFNYVAIQVNFWIFAFLLLATIIYLNSISLSKSYSLEIPLSLSLSFITSIILGLIFGITLGSIDVLIEKSFLKQKSLGFIILIRSLIYLLVLICSLSLVKIMLWKPFVINHFFKDMDPTIAHRTWIYVFYIFLLYSLAMSLVITFINLMNKKFGPGVLIPMLFGRYRHPQEEERIFMFMDLKSSTTHAENLGHIKYSAMIRDSFMDINQVLTKHNAEIYQYVGDEIVLSWPLSSDIKGMSCVDFFFGCQKQFNKRSDYYLGAYGFVPQFKAGLHIGKVTAVEVGEIKRDLAYHGDTLNTTARIQSVCNDYDKIFLVSNEIVDFTGMEKEYLIEKLGEINLKGKEIPVGVYSVEGKK